MSDSPPPQPGPDPPRGTPHDLLLREVFSDPAQAMTLFRLVLPEQVVARVDPASVRLEPGWFVDELGERASDLLFEVRLDGRSALIYVLIEHQSTVRRWLLLRLGHFVRRIWVGWQRRQPGPRRRGRRLPPVLPLILYQGRRWTAPRRLIDLVDLDFSPDVASLLERHQLQHEPLLHQLGAHELQELLARLRGPALGCLTLVVLWAGREGRDMVAAWVEAGDLVPAALAEDAERFWMVFRYVGRVGGERVARRVSAEMSRQHGAGVEAQFRSYEDALRTEGRAEGRAEGQCEVLIRFIRNRLGPEADRFVTPLQAASEETLGRVVELLAAPGSDEQLRRGLESLLAPEA